MRTLLYSAGVHFRDHKRLYLVVIFLLTMGISCGSATAVQLDIERSLHWSGALGGTLSSGQGGVFLRALFRETRFFGLILLCGIGVAGVPAAALLVGIRGFLLGFSFGFLIGNYGAGGFWIGFVAVLPQNLLIIGALLFAAVTAMRAATARKWGKTYWIAMLGAFFAALSGVGLETLLSALLPAISGI